MSEFQHTLLVHAIDETIECCVWDDGISQRVSIFYDPHSPAWSDWLDQMKVDQHWRLLCRLDAFSGSPTVHDNFQELVNTVRRKGVHQVTDLSSHPLNPIFFAARTAVDRHRLGNFLGLFFFAHSEVAVLIDKDGRCLARKSLSCSVENSIRPFDLMMFYGRPTEPELEAQPMTRYFQDRKKQCKGISWWRDLLKNTFKELIDHYQQNCSESLEPHTLVCNDSLEWGIFEIDQIDRIFVPDYGGDLGLLGLKMLDQVPVFRWHVGFSQSEFRLLTNVFGRLMDKAGESVTRRGWDFDDVACRMWLLVAPSGQPDLAVRVAWEGLKTDQELQSRFLREYALLHGNAPTSSEYWIVDAELWAIIESAMPELPALCARSGTPIQMRKDNSHPSEIGKSLEPADDMGLDLDIIPTGSVLRHPAVINCVHRPPLYVPPGWSAHVNLAGGVLLKRDE